MLIRFVFLTDVIEISCQRSLLLGISIAALSFRAFSRRCILFYMHFVGCLYHRLFPLVFLRHGPARMSEASPAATLTLDIYACSQCRTAIPRSATRQSRHAVPCGHLICSACVGTINSESKNGGLACKSPGCGQEFVSTDLFATGWCTQRSGRLSFELESLMADQGNAGDDGEGLKEGRGLASSPPQAASEPVWTKCRKHAADVEWVRLGADGDALLCAECLGTTSPEADKVERLASVDESTLAASFASVDAEAMQAKASLRDFDAAAMKALADELSQWVALETRRVRAWEERVVNEARSTAAQCLTLLQETYARRQAVLASVYAQRVALCVTLEEIEHEAAKLPSVQTERVGKLALLALERKRLVSLLSRDAFAIPSASDIAGWSSLPALVGEFGDEKTGGGNTCVVAAGTAARTLLTWCRDRNIRPGSGQRSPPMMPDLVGGACARFTPQTCESCQS